MTEADFPGYHACLDVVARECRYLSITSAPPPDASRAWVLPHLAAHHPFFVAADGDRIVGWCDITPHEREWFAHRGTMGMGVLPAYRRHGIGTSLVHAAIRHARSTGLSRIELEVFSTNLPAIALYTRLGFTKEGTLRHACKNNGTCQDILLMALLFNTAEEGPR